MASYVSLEQNSLSALGVQAPTFDGTNVSFYATSSFVYTLFFVAILLAAFYQYVLVGIYRVEASESGIRKSNETFKRTTLGLLGVFSLFLIIFMINKGLLTGDVGLGALKDTTIIAPPSTQTTSPTNPIPNTTPSGTDNTSISGDAAIRQQLASLPNGGISVNKSVCTFVAQLNCTSLGGLPSETISMLTQLRNTCSGSIVVSGGTEAGHTSHGPGRYPVDLSLGNPLESCIKSFPQGSTLNFCYSTYVKFGYIFCDEKSVQRHWHVLRR